MKVKIALLLAMVVSTADAWWFRECSKKELGEPCTTKKGVAGTCGVAFRILKAVLYKFQLDPPFLEKILAKLPKKCIETPATTPEPTTSPEPTPSPRPSCSGVFFFVQNSMTTFSTIASVGEVSNVVCNSGFEPLFLYRCAFSGFSTTVRCNPVPSTPPAKRHADLDLLTPVEKREPVLAPRSTPQTNCGNQPKPTVENGIVPFEAFVERGDEVSVSCNPGFQLMIEAECTSTGFAFTPICVSAPS